MFSDPVRMRSESENAAIVVSDLHVRAAALCAPVTAALQANLRQLLIMVNEVSDSALSLLLANNGRNHMHILAVRTPGFGREQQADFLADTAVLTGAAFLRAAGDSFESISAEDFGRACRVLADQRSFGIVGVKGNPRALGVIWPIAHGLRSRPGHRAARQAPRTDRAAAGWSATLRVGGVTVRDIEARKELADRTAATVRGAVQEGVVPGAVWRCSPAVPSCNDSEQQRRTPTERAAYKILAMPWASRCAPSRPMPARPQ